MLKANINLQNHTHTHTRLFIFPQEEASSGARWRAVVQRKPSVCGKSFAFAWLLALWFLPFNFISLQLQTQR